MSPYPIPEIRRVALESVALAVKVTHDDAKVRTLSKPLDLYLYSLRCHSRGSCPELSTLHPPPL